MGIVLFPCEMSKSHVISQHQGLYFDTRAKEGVVNSDPFLFVIQLIVNLKTLHVNLIGYVIQYCNYRVLY